jgi:Fe2+ or Zn2+ uptake regulation protein
MPTTTTKTEEKPAGDLSEELEAFRHYLKSKGYRVTREREAIAEAILRPRAL